MENETDPLESAVAFLETEAEIPDAVEPEAEVEGVGTSPSEPVAEPTLASEDKTAKKDIVEPPKPEEKLTPQMEAVARKERRLQEERTAFKTERETLTKERDAWLAEKTNYEAMERIARTDLVTLAEKVKMAPEDRQRLAIELWNSAQPEDKQAPVYREQAKQRTQAQELQERLNKLEAENQASTRRAQEAEHRAKRAEFSETIASSVESLLPQIGERAPFLTAFLKHDRANVKEDLYNLVVQAYNEDPDTQMTPAMLVERYEPLLAAKYEPVKRIFGNQAPKTNTLPEAESKSPPKTLSAQKTATPTKARVEPKSEEDLIQDAVAFLESR